MNNLQISVNSFSYKIGIPEDKSGNGGGFVFDCRGIYNPGRIEEYKKLSGLDEKVQEFLRKETEINSFLAYIFKVIDITLENYLTRGFSNLQINFGCTGGQHRSVYATEKTAEYLRKNYPQTIVNVQHTNKENWLK